MGDRGGTATRPISSVGGGQLYPMGDRGGTATSGLHSLQFVILYPMGDRGGTATLVLPDINPALLYPMGDRGGTATYSNGDPSAAYYTRWEIGGEPQHVVDHRPVMPIIPDGRSGGEPQRMGTAPTRGGELYPMGDRGGTATTPSRRPPTTQLYPMGDRGGTATLRV